MSNRSASPSRSHGDGDAPAKKKACEYCVRRKVRSERKRGQKDVEIHRSLTTLDCSPVRCDAICWSHLVQIVKKMGEIVLRRIVLVERGELALLGDSYEVVSSC